MFHTIDSKLEAYRKAQVAEEIIQAVEKNEDNGSTNEEKLTIIPQAISLPLIGDVQILGATAQFSPLALSGTVDIFGDSIARGAGVTSAQRWTKLACNSYGATENNLAIDGDMTTDMTIRVYGNAAATPGSAAYIGHVNGRQTIFSVGINDIYLQLETAYDELKRTLESLVLYCTLPAAKKLDVRSASVIKSGAWFNTPAFNKGMYTMTNGASVTATVTGRYVVFAATILNGALLNSHSNISVTVDGVVINNVLPRYSGTTLNSYNFTNFINSLWLYDTESASTTSHTITITQVAQTGIGIFFTFVDWIGAFSPSEVGCSAVFVCTPDTTDWAASTAIYGPLTGAVGSERAWHTIRQNIQKVVQKWNIQYGLPIYYVDMGTTNIYGQKIDDLVHPNVNGHKLLANRFISLLNNGTYNTLWI